MNGLERTRRALRGQRVDRIPVFPILLAPACQLTGTRQGDYNRDPAVMTRTLIAARELCGFDGIYVSRDNWVCHQALGGDLVFPDDDESYAARPLLDGIDGVGDLTLPEPATAPGMSTLLAAAGLVMGAEGDKSYVQANIDTGPFSLAAVLVGTQEFLLALRTEEESALRPLLDFCTEVVIAYGLAMIAAGVHGIQFGDATASLVSAADYSRFVLPYQRRALEALGGRGCDLWIHICGRTGHLLPLLRELPFQGFEVDAKVGMPAARALLGPDIALKGNLDTTFLLQGSPAEIRSACRSILASGPFTTGMILSPGCGVPRMTPLANLRAMAAAAEDHAAG
jgi:uroporphyrinogen decarboxylase